MSLSSSEWLVQEEGFNLQMVNLYETLFTLGNGYLGTRGALEEGIKGANPATYIAGIFDHNESAVEELVNAPDWLPFSVWVDGVQVGLQMSEALSHYRALDMKKGMLYRKSLFKMATGDRVQLESWRFVSMANRHLLGMRTKITLLDNDGMVVIVSGVDGNTLNLDRQLPFKKDKITWDAESKWDKWSKCRHLRFVGHESYERLLGLKMETIESGHQLFYAHGLTRDTNDYHYGGQWVDYQRTNISGCMDAKKGTTYTFDKLVSVYTTRDISQEDIVEMGFNTLHNAYEKGFDQVFEEHQKEWQKRWETCDVRIGGNAGATHALRFNIYHLLTTGNEEDPRVNIAAKGLSGEGYKGHVFWDTEIFMLPFFIYTQPETAKALLLYRYYTLPGAKKNAEDTGYKGARYAWESTDDGLETTPKWTADGRIRIWTGEEEIHITADVTYGILTYVEATNDVQFMIDFGAEILFETARFWASRLELNVPSHRYELNRVIGPDEFHLHVKNNVFTNYLTKWALEKTCDWYKFLNEYHWDDIEALKDKLIITDHEVDQWAKMARMIYIPIDQKKNLIEQFEGYFQCKDVPITQWDENKMPIYPEGYNHDNADETQLVKQPDVVMLMFLLPDEFSDDEKRINYEYYEERTMHKSSLSPSMHSIMGIESGDKEKAVHYFYRSAFVDLNDNQKNAEQGMHMASAGGTWMAAVFGFGGFRVKNGKMAFSPWLPKDWTGLHFTLAWKGNHIKVHINHQSANFELISEKPAQESIEVNGKPLTLQANQPASINL